MNIRETVPSISELEKISTRTDTRDYLAKAARDARGATINQANAARAMGEGS